MAFEFIRRKEGEVSQKTTIKHENIQVSINDWGHLVIREFDNPRLIGNCYNSQECCTKPESACRDCEHYKVEREDEEHLIVFDKVTTEKILNFIFSVRSTFEFKQLLRSILDKRSDDIPF